MALESKEEIEKNQ